MIDLYGLGGLLPHFSPCDDTLVNSRFQILKLSRVQGRKRSGWIKRQFSKEYHVVCNEKQTTQAKKVYCADREVFQHEKTSTFQKEKPDYEQSLAKF